MLVHLAYLIFYGGFYLAYKRYRWQLIINIQSFFVVANLVIGFIGFVKDIES